jgi:FkbM family methyltransferase
MKFLVIFFLDIFDFFYRLSFVNFLKKNKIRKFDIIFDVGAHHGESIKFFNKYFNVKKIYSFEPSPINFANLKRNIQKKNFKSFIILENLGLGLKSEKRQLNQTIESSSSTFNEINYNSKYYNKKKNLLNFFSNKRYVSKIDTTMSSLKNYITINKINKIDLLKIDTEGFEFDVLSGLQDEIKKVKFIFFEHHYDDMYKKEYTYSDISKLLKYNNFKMVHKNKMPFRKTFEYLWVNGHI